MDDRSEDLVGPAWEDGCDFWPNAFSALSGTTVDKMIAVPDLTNFRLVIDIFRLSLLTLFPGPAQRLIVRLRCSQAVPVYLVLVAKCKSILEFRDQDLVPRGHIRAIPATHTPFEEPTLTGLHSSP